MKIRQMTVIGALIFALGCGTNPGQNSAPVDVSGVVQTVEGKPVGNVTVQFVPTAQGQLQGGAQLKADGKFQTKLAPGKYTVVIEGNPMAMKQVPTKYHSADAANSVEVPAKGAQDLTIKLN